MRNHQYVFALILCVTLLFSSPASACIAYFGYTGSGADEVDTITDYVDVSTGYVTVTSETEYIVNDVESVYAIAGPVVLNLQEIIFKPDVVSGINCTHYERGGTSNTNPFYLFWGDYQSHLDTFFSINAALFQGTTVKVAVVMVHSEANNACVQNWKLNSAAAYVKTKLQKPGYYLPRIAVGYGLTNHPGGVSKGFPVNTDGTIAKFPSNLTLIGYWAYDIFNPNLPSHVNNLNNESWTTISGKLDQALWTHQKTAGVFKAFCSSSSYPEINWGITCPNLYIWKLGVLANNWRDYWLNDPRNEMVLAFHWPDVGFYGTESLPTLWSYHSNIDAARNCTMTFVFYQ